MREGLPESLFRREAKAVVQQGWLIAKHLRRTAQRPMGPRVAVFVHGFMAAGPVFDPMREEVTRRTTWETLDFNYGPLSSLDVITERFARTIEQRVPRSSRLALVGHSLGGLLCRRYIQLSPGARSVERLITLATPHAGTRSVRYVPGVLATALRPDSDAILALGTSVTRGGESIPHTAVVAGRDKMVTPPSSAGAVDQAQVIHFEDLGHNELLFDSRVYDVVVEALER